MQSGDKVQFTTDSQHEVFTVKAVSAFVEMVQIAEIGLWFYLDFLAVVNPPTQI